MSKLSELKLKRTCVATGKSEIITLSVKEMRGMGLKNMFQVWDALNSQAPNIKYEKL
jgi:hypothetical protein